MMKQVVGQQGEVRIVKVESFPDVATMPVKKDGKGFIISHSESGHHHILTDGEVMERQEVPEGMKIFHAILKDPAEFIQDAGVNSHGSYALDPGLYEFRVSREYDPFAQQARRVAD